MALNSDFKVKNSLYVGNSACFVTCTDTPRILSGGTDLWDIFLQEGEVAASCTLQNGTGIATFSYDGSANTCVAIDSTCNTTWNSAYTTLNATSGGNVFDVSGSATQGRIVETLNDGTVTNIDLTNLGATGSPTFDSISLCNLSNVVDNTILTINGSGGVGTDEVDSKIFGTELVDGEGTSGTVPVYSNGTGTIGDSNIRIDGSTYVYIDGGLSATGTLSGDGSGLTGVTATPTFPTNGTTDLSNNSKIFVNDGASCEVACNKHITYQNLLDDLVGVGLQAEPGGGTDEIGLKDNANFTNNTHLKWDDGNGQLTNSIASDDGTTMTIAGSATIQGDLTVQGTFTCLDTIVSTTSAITVTNHGTGPALEVNQAGTNCTVAEFNDSDGGHTTVYDGGKLGVNTCAAPDTTVGISGTLSASNTITTGGNLNVCGNTVLGNSTSDTVCIAACGVVFCSGLGNVVDNTVLTMNSSGQVGSDEIDGKVWAGSLVDYGSSTSNTVPKFTDASGTIGDSAITDSGSLITLDSNTQIGDGNTFSTYAANGTNFTSEATFSETVHTSGTNVPTFTKTNLKQVKYEITLVSGVNVTSFEVNAVYNGTTPCGTTYAIVDAQAASQLADIEISSTGSTIDLDITSASNNTTAVVKGTALY